MWRKVASREQEARFSSAILIHKPQAQGTSSSLVNTSLTLDSTFILNHLLQLRLDDRHWTSTISIQYVASLRCLLSPS